MEIIPYNIIRILGITVRTTILAILLLSGGVGAASLIMENNDTADYIRGQEGVVIGNVTTSNGTPVANAEISISGPSYRNTYTDENGIYLLEGLSTGNYTVYAYPPYGSDLAWNYTNVIVRSGETRIVDIILRIAEDWKNEWTGEDSEGGSAVTTAELQDAIHHWLKDIPVREHIMSTADLQQIITLWLSG